jgi:hypothetical protein
LIIFPEGFHPRSKQRHAPSDKANLSENRVANDVFDDALQRGHVLASKLVMADLRAKEVVGEHFQHDHFDFGFKADCRALFAAAFQVQPQCTNPRGGGLPKCLLELCEPIQLKKLGLSKRRRRHFSLTTPVGSVAGEQCVHARRLRDANEGERVAVELSLAVSGLHHDGLDHSRIAGDEDWGKSKDVQIPIVAPQLALD